jgi:uncharacterized membrane protein HdeD (DUF308 family)
MKPYLVAVKGADVSTAIPGDSRRLDDLPNWVRRTWLVPLVLGILMLILGLVLLFNIRAGIDTLRWLVVFTLIFAAVEAFATASLRTKPWVGWLVGIAYVIGAIMSIVWPGLTLLALVIIVGASLLVGGILQAIMAWRVRKTANGWAWSFAFGLLSAVAGLVFLFGSPMLSLVVLAILLAIYVIMTGVTLIALAWAIRKATTAIAGA